MSSPPLLPLLQAVRVGAPDPERARLVLGVHVRLELVDLLGEHAAQHRDPSV